MGKFSGVGDVNSEIRQREHESLHTGLLEVVVGGKCFGEATPLHDNDGQAVGEAPILVAAAPVQIDSSTVEFGIERDNFNALVGVRPAIAFGGGGACRRISERGEPLQSTASVVTILLPDRITAACQAMAWEWY